MRILLLIALALMVAVAIGANKMAHSEQKYLNRVMTVNNGGN